MAELQFRGYSDDTFGEYLLTNIDSDNCGSGKPISFEVSAGNEAIIVTGRYSPHDNGCWEIGVMPKEEDMCIYWECRIDFDDYSPVLSISIPNVEDDEVVITNIE